MKLSGPGRLSLRFMLLLYVVAPLTISLALTGFLALSIWERQVEARMQSDLEIVARAIQLPLSHAMERNRQGGMEQALKSALSIDSVYSAYAYDLDGRQIASAGMEDPQPEREKLTELLDHGEKTGEYGQVGERRVYSYFVPLSDSRDQSSGLLQLTRRERDFRDYIGKVRRHAIVWLGLAAVATALLVMAGQHQALEKHFKRLIGGMQRISAGEKEHRIPLTGPREIVAVSTSFNEMLDSIQHAESELEVNRMEQMAMKEQLRQNEKLAAIGQLAAGVAHELGTPLSTISGSAQRGLRQSQTSPQISEFFQKIRQEVNRIEIIIRQLLDFSHRRRLQYRTLRPAQVAASAVAAVADDASELGAELSVCGDRLAPAFSADPIRLEQALVNLLRNSIQAGKRITVRLGWKVQKQQMIFSVDDSGPGIPDDIRSRVFEPFFTTKSVGIGTGLGLAVVHGIISEQGGSVRVGRSHDLGGARFEISLPRLAGERDDP